MFHTLRISLAVARLYLRLCHPILQCSCLKLMHYSFQLRHIESALETSKKYHSGQLFQSLPFISTPPSPLGWWLLTKYLEIKHKLSQVTLEPKNKKLKMELPFDLAILFLVETKIPCLTGIRIPMFTAALLTLPKHGNNLSVCCWRMSG